MDVQLLREAAIEPTPEVLALCFGKANDAYVKLTDELKAGDIEVSWRYYNDGKAWLGKAQYKWVNTRGTQKEMTACWISAWDGFFKVSVFVPEKARAGAESLPLTDVVKNMIQNGKQIGKLKFFPVIFDVRSNELIPEIVTLVNFRKKIK